MEVYRLPDWVKSEEDLELYHHGIKGQRWGVRRYQNPDGTLTAAGRAKLQKGVALGNTHKTMIKTLKKTGITEDRINSSENVKDSYKKLKEYTKVLDEIDNAFTKSTGKETTKIDKELQKDGKSLDEFDMSYIQIGLINRGINPNRYSRELKKYEDAYEESVKKEVDNLLGELSQKPLSESSKYTYGDRVSGLINAKSSDILRESEYIRFEYDSDEPYFKKLMGIK